MSGRLAILSLRNGGIDALDCRLRLIMEVLESIDDATLPSTPRHFPESAMRERHGRRGKCGKFARTAPRIDAPRDDEHLHANRGEVSLPHQSSDIPYTQVSLFRSNKHLCQFAKSSTQTITEHAFVKGRTHRP